MKPKRKDPNSRTIDPLKKFSAWQVRDADRDISAEIIDVLRSIDFDHGRLKDLVDEEEYRTMIKVRDVAARMLGVSPAGNTSVVAPNAFRSKDRKVSPTSK